MNEPISASVLIIGNEILSGKTQDANLQFLAGAFARLGITLAEARVVRDEHDVIAAVLNELRERHTYVFTTGGIGPTHDDITAESVALAFGVELTLSEEAARRISRGSRDLNPSRLKMAMIPQGASLIDNPLSHAPGFRMENVFVVDIYRREGDFAASLSEIAARHTEVEIGSYPFSRDGRFGASIVVRGTSAPHIEAALNEIRNSLDTEN